MAPTASSLIGTSSSKARSAVRPARSACSRGMMPCDSFLRMAFPISARTRSGAMRRSPLERTAFAAPDPGSSTTHFTAIDASTIRLIVVPVLADERRRVDRRVPAHPSDPIQLGHHFGLGRPHLVAKRLARDLVDGRALCGRLGLEVSGDLILDVANQDVDHEHVPLAIKMIAQAPCSEKTSPAREPLPCE